MSSSAWSRPMAGRRPKRCCTALKCCRAGSWSYKDQTLEEMDLDALIARRPQDRAGRRTRAHQRAGQPPSEALSRRRGAAVPRHRRLYRGQHPAHRKPQRCGRADHACAGARDRAGQGVRPRRRHRTDRPHARRPDPAAEGGQGLCPQAGRARAGALFLAGQPDRAARTGAAAHRRAGRRAVAHPHAGQRHRRTLGRGRAHPGLRQRGSARGRPRALHQAAGRPAARAMDRDQHRDAAQPATDRRAARPAGRHHAAGGSARRRGADHSRRRPPHRRRRHPFRACQQRHADHHRQVDALVVVRTDARFGRARSGAALPAISASTSSPATNRAWRSRRCRPRRGRSRSIRGPI